MRFGVKRLEVLGNNIAIDEEIAEVIEILNEKGYHTSGCCAGHMEVLYNNEAHGYIQLEEGYYFPGGISNLSNENNCIDSLHGFDCGRIEWGATSKEELESVHELLKKYVGSLSDFIMKDSVPDYFCVVYTPEEGVRRSMVMRGFAPKQVEDRFKFFYPMFELNEIVDLDEFSVKSLFLRSRAKNYRV